MLKPGPNFKMTKANKYTVAKILDPHRRGEIKRGLIDAQLASEIRVKSNKEDRKSGPTAAQ
jgi:hypothetical protein